MSVSQNKKALFGLFATVFVFFILLCLFIFMASSSFNEVSETEVKGKGPIAVIEVEGVIMDSKNTVKLLHKAEEDQSIKAIIMRINSPGGAVGPTQEIYDEIRRIDLVKPIYASFGTIAASGGYYLGAATREIWTNPGTITGSIGVIMQFTDLSKVYEYFKVAPQTIKAGRYKDAGDPSRAITEEEKGMLNVMIEGVHKQFIRDIFKTRKNKIKSDQPNELFQGQIFSGEQAKELGLVDELGNLWELGRRVHKRLKLSGEPGLIFLKNRKSTNWFELLENVEESISQLSLKNAIFNNSAHVLMYK